MTTLSSILGAASTGYTGSQGAIGYTGSRGATGFTGSQGAIGYTGSKGDTGFTGSQGVIGYTGSSGANTAAQYTWSNTHTFNANVTITSPADLILTAGAGISANGSFGTDGQVLTVNSTGGTYWAPAAAGVNTAAQYTWSNSHAFSVGGDAVSFTGATNNRIKFNTNGVAAPSFTTYSNGTKIVLYDSVGASSTGYAIGIDGSTLWYGTSTDAESHKWYGGTTLHTTANTTGLYHTSSVRAPTFYNSSDTNVRWSPNDMVLRGGSPTIFFRDTDHNSAMVHVNSNVFYVLRGANDTETWSQVGGYWPLEINLTNNNAVFGGTIWAASNITAYSDARLKENIVTIDNALDKVLKLRGVYYTQKRDPESTRKLGVIAQEVQQVIPEVVVANEGNEDMLGVDYGNMVGVLIEAIKEQQNMIEEQAAKISKLEEKLSQIIPLLENK